MQSLHTNGALPSAVLVALASATTAVARRKPFGTSNTRKLEQAIGTGTSESTLSATDPLKLLCAAFNVTNESMSTHGRFANQLLDGFASGRRYALGARFRT